MASAVKNCNFIIGGKQYGPVSEQVIISLHNQGKVDADTKFIRAGMKDWISLAEAGILPAETIQERNCYISIDGKQHGPMSKRDILKLYADKKINGETEFMRIGAKEWIPLSRVISTISPNENRGISPMVRNNTPGLQKSSSLSPGVRDDLPPLPVEEKKSRAGLIVMLCSVVAVAAAIAVFFFITNNNSDSSPTPTDNAMEQITQTPVGVPEEEEEITPALNPLAIYSPILNIYATGESDDGVDFASCEYAFYDIDSNGIVELLIRYESDMYREEKIYTYVDGTIYKIGEFWDRNRLASIDNDGVIYNPGSSGAALNSITTYRISDDKTSLDTIDYWVADFDNNDFTHTSNGEEKSITEQEFSDTFDMISNDDGILGDLVWLPLYPNSSSGATQSEYLDDVFYKGIEISLILEEPFESILGNPTDIRGPYFDYDGLEIIAEGNDDTRTQSINGTDLSLFEINGVSLDKNKEELIAAFGSPIERYDEVMRYHVYSYIVDYVLEFWFVDPDGNAHSIRIIRFGL